MTLAATMMELRRMVDAGEAPDHKVAASGVSQGVLHFDMVSKSSAAKSVRLQNDLWERLAAEALRRGVAVNNLVASLLEVGLLKAAERRFVSEGLTKPLQAAERVTYQRLRVPRDRPSTFEDLINKPGPAVELGPQRAAPGSLLKKPKDGK